MASRMGMILQDLLPATQEIFLARVHHKVIRDPITAKQHAKAHTVPARNRDSNSFLHGPQANLGFYQRPFFAKTA
jgi:hypothetical protein